MISKFFKRLAILAVAFLVTCISNIEIARAYLYVDLAWVGIIVAVFVAVIALGGAIAEENIVAGIVNFAIVFLMGLAVAVDLAFSFMLSRLFNIDFFTAYVVIDFIMCLIPSKKNE